MSARRGIPFVIAAPSGTGKTTLCRRVVARDGRIRFSVSHTTRPPRAGERDGVDYHFVTPAQFEALVAQDAFLEWAVYNGRRYGTSWTALEEPLAAGRDVLLEIEIQGAEQVAARSALEARLIFLVPPSRDALETRLRRRGTDTPDVIERRLTIAQHEFEAVHFFDYVVVNDDLGRAVGDVIEIVEAERAGRASALAGRFGREAVLARIGPALGMPAA